MTIITKQLTDPATLEQFKAEGQVVLEVQMTRYYIFNPGDQKLEDIVHDWFVKWKGRSHAFRDGSHVGGGGDTVTAVKELTTGKDIPILAKPPTCPRCGGKGWVFRPNPASCISSEFDATVPCPECTTEVNEIRGL